MEKSMDTPLISLPEQPRRIETVMMMVIRMMVMITITIWEFIGFLAPNCRPGACLYQRVKIFHKYHRNKNQFWRSINIFIRLGPSSWPSWPSWSTIILTRTNINVWDLAAGTSVYSWDGHGDWVQVICVRWKWEQCWWWWWRRWWPHTVMMPLMMTTITQGTDWQRSGGLLASQCKDKILRIFDPRTGGGPTQVLMM